MTIHIDVRNKRGKAKDKALTQAERQSLRDEIKNSNHGIIFVLGAYAGMRSEEIAQCRLSWLEWKTFNNKKCLAINIPARDRDAKNKAKIFQTKTRSERTTYIFDMELSYKVHTWYLHNVDGLLISNRYIRQVVRLVFNNIIGRDVNDQNHLHTHALRSSAQNLWKFEYKFDDTFIQLCFGWKDARTMLSHYQTMNKSSGESYLMGIENIIK